VYTALWRNIEVVTTLPYRQNCHCWTALLSIQHWRSDMYIIDENFLSCTLFFSVLLQFLTSFWSQGPYNLIHGDSY